MSESNQYDAHARIDELEQRIEALEQQLEGQTTATGTLDRYDASVLDTLTPGDKLTLEGLRNRYRRAGIVRDSTIKQRIKRLTSLEYFETEGRGWRFVGVENE